MPPVSLLSQHGRVLAEIASNPQVRVPDLAHQLDVTDRAAQRLVAALVEAGHVERRREGRRILLSVASAELAEQIGAIGAVDTSGARSPSTRRDDLRLRLLAAAETLVDDTGTFTAFSVEDLLRTAGVSRSTFYAYFSDKDDLLQALVQNFLNEMWVAAQTWTTLGPGLTRDDLRRAMDAIGAAHRPHRMAMTAAAEAGPANANVKAQYDHLMLTTKGLVRDHIVRGKVEGFINSDLDPDATAALLTWGAELRLSKLPSDATPDKVDRVIEALTGLVWNLLYAGAA